MTAILTERGYELIAADGSPDMLAQAREKAAGLTGEPPVFLNQDMTELNLYGTVDAAVCCLDSLNYLTSPKDVQKCFQRLHLFIAPGGVLVFDINSAAKLAALDGQVFLDEREEHRQRAYTVDELRAWLMDAGFTRVRTYGDCRMSAPRENEQRIYFSAIRGK